MDSVKRIAVSKGMTFYPIGNGTKKLTEKMQDINLLTPGKGGVIPALTEIVRNDQTSTVGGSLQFGIATRNGFLLPPVLQAEGKADRGVRFLGLDVSSLSKIEGYNIGFQARSPES